MPKKKSWKERHIERQKKQQGSQKAYQTQRERDAKRKPRHWPIGKILVAVFLIAIVVGVYALWQYSTKPFTLIYIRADGSVDPSTASILNVDNRYTFTADIYGSVVIEKDNIVVDGANYGLQGQGGTGSKGIDLSGRRNVTITNLRLEDFGYGVYLYTASDNVLSQNYLVRNNYGIALESSSDNALSGNNITSNRYGISLSSSSGNTIRQNSMASNQYSVSLAYSSGNVISENDIAYSEGAIGLSYSLNNNITENNVANNQYSISITYESSSNNIIGNSITNSDGAILLASSNNNNVSGNQMNNNQQGIRLDDSSENSISGNSIANGDEAITLTSSSDNVITENDVTGNQKGISLTSSSDNRIFHNSLVSNTNQVNSLDSLNAWDDGYPSGGNYWSDYETRYPEAEELDDSGIWDTPYVIDQDNSDNYPLMNR